MNFNTLLPSLSPEIQEALASAGITTAQDLVLTQTQQLHSRLPSGLVSIRELADLKAQIAERVAAPAVRGDELFEHETEAEQAREPCYSGVKELDDLLGGFGKYGTIEIAGGNKSSKTNDFLKGLVLNIVLRHLANYPEHRILWLDVGGEFAIERAADILELHSGPGSETALERLSIITCFDIAAAHQAIEDLRKSLASQNEEHRLRFLVIDTLTPLLAPLLSGTSSQGHAVMVTFMRVVGSLARTYLFTNLVTNSAAQSHPTNPYSAFPTTVTKPALGPTFMFLTDDTLWLSDAMHMVDQSKVERGSRVFVAEVLRSHSTFSQTWCAFIFHEGIRLERYPYPVKIVNK